MSGKLFPLILPLIKCHQAEMNVCQTERYYLFPEIASFVCCSFYLGWFWMCSSLWYAACWDVKLKGKTRRLWVISIVVLKIAACIWIVELLHFKQNEVLRNYLEELKVHVAMKPESKWSIPRTSFLDFQMYFPYTLSWTFWSHLLLNTDQTAAFPQFIRLTAQTLASTLLL